MVQFYVSMVFIGAVLVVYAMLSVAVDRKKEKDYASVLEAKKQELVEIISDAEMMVDELNRFSGYIVDTIEEKKDLLSRKQDPAGTSTDSTGKHKDSETSDSSLADQVPQWQDDPRLIPGTAADENARAVPANQRQREILQLAEEGLSETEIARKLGIGKGEIQLILVKLGQPGSGIKSQ